jgi:competence protein ComGF
MKINKIKAFTLMELAVGMLLTTITAAAGFSMYLYFIKTIKKHKDDEEKVKNLHAYYFQLENDLENAQKIFPSENGIILYNDENKIIYHLEDTLLIREISDVSKDTFHLHTSSFKIPDENLINDNVTEFSIEQKLNKQEMIWQWKKEYSPVESINQYILSDGH